MQQIVMECVDEKLSSEMRKMRKGKKIRKIEERKRIWQIVMEFIEAL